MITPTRTYAVAILAFALFAGCAKDSVVDLPPSVPDQTNGRTTVINDQRPGWPPA